MQFMNLLTANYSVKYWGIVVIEHVGELSTTPYGYHAGGVGDVTRRLPHF